MCYTGVGEAQKSSLPLTLNNTNGVYLMRKLFLKLKKNKRGAAAVEYALLTSLISVAIIGGAQAVGGSIEKKFQAISTAIDKIHVPK